MISLLFSAVSSQIVSYPPWPPSQQLFPPDCRNQSTFPDSNEAIRTNFFAPDRAEDPCAPLGPRPAIGQQVYIQDPINFCLVLPFPYAGVISDIYASGRRPTILDGEGYLQSFCLGDYMTPGAWPMPTGAIISAHVLTGVINNQRYIQISGNMNCDALNMNCESENFADGGQYDTAPYLNFGKSPYSGVDTARNPNMPVYNMQAGNKIFCMRVCERGPNTDGMQLEDPCNVKNDTAGCFATMNNPSFEPGFVMEGRIFPAPPQLPSSTSSTGRSGGSATNGGSTPSSGSESSAGLIATYSWEFLLGLAAFF